MNWNILLIILTVINAGWAIVAGVETFSYVLLSLIVILQTLALIKCNRDKEVK